MASDFNKPVVGDAYATLLPGVVTMLQDLARGLEPTATGSHTNIPTNTVRWNAGTNLWEKYNGTSWAALSSSYAISISGTATTATTATKLAGGVAGAIAFQSAPATTGFTAAGTSGQVLTSAGAGTPVWTSQSALSVGTASAVAWSGITSKPTLLSTIATNDLGNYGGWITSAGTSAACSGNSASATTLVASATIPGNPNFSGGSGALRIGGSITRFEGQISAYNFTTGFFSVAHGGPRKPDMFKVVLRCTSAISGWAIGDECEIQNWSTSMNCNAFATSTVVGFAQTGAAIIANRSASGGINPTSANFTMWAYALWL